jgi:hypothetical protein
MLAPRVRDGMGGHRDARLSEKIIHAVGGVV